MIKLITALGNPGYQYKDSRHNIAWLLLEFLPFYDELNWKNKFSGEYASFRIKDEIRYFLRPLTFMNLSGQSIIKAMDYLKIETDEVLIIHDELELEFGVMGFKEGGGLGGHNGLRSIATALNTNEFKRVRLGISRPPHDDITSYVLDNFSEKQRVFLEIFLDQASELVYESLIIKDFNTMIENYKKLQIIQT